MDTTPRSRGFLKLLLKNPFFATASPHDLGWLLSQATYREALPGNVICDAGTEAFTVLIDGMYEVEHTPGSDKHLISCSKSGGNIIGLEVLLSRLLSKEEKGLEMPRIVAESESKYFWVPNTALRTLIERSSAFRQSVHHLQARLSGGAPSSPQEVGRGTVTQFNCLVPGLPLSLLIYLLAQEIVRQFPGDSVAILRPGGGGESQTTPVPGLSRLVIVHGSAEQVSHLKKRFDYVFLDGLNYDVPDLVVSLLRGTPDREREYLPTESNQPALLQTVVLTEHPPPCGTELKWEGANWATNRIVRTARLRVELAALRALATNWNPATAPLVIGPTMRRSIAAWARAVTQRRTGLALAGGGAWSMQAIHVLRELHRRNVPIDVITSSSAGSMIGAYYAVKGVDGLDRLLEQADCGTLDLMAFLAIATTPAAISGFFARNLGSDTCLESLDLEFHPASTNITEGKGVIFVSGPLSSAIAASGASVPMVATALNQNQRFVDGAFSNNVPVQALSYFNATLTFGLNTFPVARRPESYLPQVLQSLFRVGPLNRMLDFTTAFNTLGSLSGAIECDWAKVRWNNHTTRDLTYLQTLNFFSAAELVEAAAYDVELNAKIDDFEARWLRLKYRGSLHSKPAVTSLAPREDTTALVPSP